MEAFPHKGGGGLICPQGSFVVISRKWSCLKLSWMMGWEEVEEVTAPAERLISVGADDGKAINNTQVGRGPWGG